MKTRLASVWIAVSSASLLSLICHSLAYDLAAYHRSLEAELPLVSAVFFPDALAIYLFPLPLLIWAALHCARSRDNPGISLLIVTATLSLSLIFIALFLLAMTLPFIPGYVTNFTQ